MNTLQTQDILLLIDVQYSFINSSKTKLIKSLCGLTKEFRDTDKQIIIVETTGFGMTLSRITDIISYYQRQSRIAKNFEDGSKYILNQFPSYKSDKEVRFHIGGVNWSQCVFQTTKGLLENSNCKIVAHKYASNPNFRKCDSLWLGLIEKYQDRILVVDRNNSKYFS